MITPLKSIHGSGQWSQGNSKERLFKLKDIIGTRSVSHRLAMNNLTMKTKVQVLIIGALKLCYGFLKLSCYIKESELEFDKTLKGIVFPRRHGSCMRKLPQRVEKRLNCSLFALHLSYASGFCGYFWRARRIRLPFTLFAVWQAYTVCLRSVLAFLRSVVDRPS